MNNNISGITDWIKEGIGKFKEAIGIGQPKPVIAGTALIEAQKLLNYCQIRPIKSGDRGDMVATLQFLLDILGYKTYTGEKPDGIFGTMTYRAVIGYQKSRGLKPDGIVGKLTAFKIYQEIGERTKIARILPTATQQWINREVYKRIENIKKEKRPEIVVSQKEETEATTLMPKGTEHGVFSYFKTLSPTTKKYLLAGAIAIIAYLVSNKKRG